jgi:hypothetical protein
MLRVAAEAAIKSYQMVWKIWFGEIPPGFRMLCRSGDLADGEESKPGSKFV